MGKVKKYTSFLHTNYSNATQRKKICEKDRKQLYFKMSEAWKGVWYHCGHVRYYYVF